MSVASGSESEGSSPAPSQVPKLKRTHRVELKEQSSSCQSQAQSLRKSTNQLESFKFPVSKRILEYSKKGKPLEEEDRKELIRDCVTCLKAECGDHITKEQFKLASQIICDKVPVLKDVEPINWPEDEEFDSTVSKCQYMCDIFNTLCFSGLSVVAGVEV